MGGSPSDDSGGANIPTSREEYEEAVGLHPNKYHDYNNSSAKGADEDLAIDDIFSHHQLMEVKVEDTSTLWRLPRLQR